MKKDISKKVLYAVVGLVLISGFVLVYSLTKKEEDEKPLGNGVEGERVITQEDVDNIYTYLNNVNCDDVLIWDVGVGEELKAENFSKEKINDLILRHLEVNNKLSDDISLEDFNKSKDVMFGTDFKKEIILKNHKYKDYSYTLSDNRITRTKSSTCKEETYDSKSFGYSSVANPLIIHIAVGYTKDKTMYNLEDISLGGFESDEMKQELLTNSTTFEYRFEPKGDLFVLKSVSKALKVLPTDSHE